MINTKRRTPTETFLGPTRRRRHRGKNLDEKKPRFLILLRRWAWLLGVEEELAFDGGELKSAGLRKIGLNTTATTTAMTMRRNKINPTMALVDSL